MSYFIEIKSLEDQFGRFASIRNIKLVKIMPILTMFLLRNGNNIISKINDCIMEVNIS